MTDQRLAEVSYARRGPAAWITLDRPAKRNALTPAMVGGLHQALDRADRDPALRAIVITGAGPAFCAGADLEFFRGALAEPDGCERFMAGLLRPLADFLARLRSSPRPVIAAVNGACAAGGVELAVCCDLIVAAGLRARADALADALAQRSPHSLARMKELVHRAQDPPWEQLVEADLADFRANWGSADLREGIAAYAEHRGPKFVA
jgi:enoyl-CoA hydratase/carnithine racemase